MATTDQTTTATSTDGKGKAAKPLPFIVIYNNGNSHRLMALRGHSTALPGGKSSYVDGESFKLIVGSNIIARRLWDAWKEQNQDTEIDGVPTEGQVSILLTGRIPTTINRFEGEGKVWLEEGPGVASATNPLGSLDESQARKLVTETLEEPVLKRWLQTEKRPVIVDLLGRKLEDFKRGLDEAQRRAAG